jgi:GLPGLI family protein
MSKNIALTFIIVLMACAASAQYKFVERGRITFERKINTYAILPKFVNKSDVVSPSVFASYVQGYKDQHPQFWIDNFQLTFDKDKTLYEPVGRISDFMHGVGVPVSHANKVYTDLLNSNFIAEKFAYNELKIVKDSIAKIRWKLTAETREIAGYECRRANALIRDSIYVVAFYTDAIKCNGGPESFSGLPGIILGVVLPHQHISYFATRVDILDACYLPPVTEEIREKAISQKQFDMAVTSYLKSSNQLNGWTRVFMGL